MAIEWLPQYSPIDSAINSTSAEIWIDAASFRNSPPERLLTVDEVDLEIQRLKTPVERRTFPVGPLGRKINPISGAMNEEDQVFIKSVCQRFRERRIDCPNCFERELFGRVGMRDEDATKVDRLSIDTSDVITVLPDASISNGTWQEFIYGNATGKSFIFTFRRENPELEFQEKVKQWARYNKSRSRIVFVTFDSLDDLFEQIDQIWDLLVDRKEAKLNGHSQVNLEQLNRAISA